MEKENKKTGYRKENRKRDVKNYIIIFPTPQKRKNVKKNPKLTGCQQRKEMRKNRNQAKKTTTKTPGC